MQPDPIALVALGLSRNGWKLHTNKDGKLRCNAQYHPSYMWNNLP